MKFVAATNNSGKLREIKAILSVKDIKVVSLAEVGLDIDILETGEIFYENALIKAKAVCSATGQPAIANDSGLVVRALGGAPGIYSSSFGGTDLNDSARCAVLLEKMDKVEQREAVFVCDIVCMFPNGVIISAQGECHGVISRVPSGQGGFGYDPVFFLDSLGKTMAELSSNEKNYVSHRAKALLKLADIFEQIRYTL